jgi:hypothetical protein
MNSLFVFARKLSPTAGIVLASLVGIAAIAAVAVRLLHSINPLTRMTVATVAAPAAPLAPSDCDLDPTFFYDGNIVCTRDLQFIESYCRRGLANARQQGRSDAAAHFQNTISLIDDARSRHPQAERFQCSLTSSSVDLSPYDWRDRISVEESTTADVVIVGAELPSLTMAIDAADRGYSVIVVHAGPLGGICADTGANLRFFDFIKPTSHPNSQIKLFDQALAVGNFVAIPPDTDAKLTSYFARAYSGRVRFVKTHSYDSLHVDLDRGRLADIVTDEGVQIAGQYFIDTDPESRIAEKCGIPMDIDTPDLSYGVVFDVDGLSSSDLDALELHDRISPDQLMDSAGVTLDQVEASPTALHAYHLLQRSFARDQVFHGRDFRLGYNALAEGFDFKMQCMGLAEPDNDQLKWLNAHRTMSGFNIAQYGGTCNFNAVSYFLPRTVMQYSHSLAHDFPAIVDTDLPAMSDYLQYVTGDSALTVRAPAEFYVRKSTAFFKLLHPYRASEFNGPADTPYYVFYQMDYRDLQERDSYGWNVVQRYVDMSLHKNFWNCRASATETAVPNLFLINKDGLTPAYSGGQRILGSQINFGAALMASLPPSFDRRGPARFVELTGTVVKYDRAEHALTLSAQSVSLPPSPSVAISPARSKPVSITRWTTIQANMAVGAEVTVDGWDHGAMTRIWATDVQSAPTRAG